MKKITTIIKNQKKVIFKLLYSFRWPRDWFFCKIKGISWHHSSIFWGLPIIQTYKHGAINFGQKCVLCSDPRHNSLGVFQKVIIKTIGQNARITIGDDVGISGATISARKRIIIGNNVLIGTGALITDSDSHPLKTDGNGREGHIVSKEIVIEDDVFIGARSIILKGVTVGKGAVIGAGSVVAKNVDPFTVVAGNPAKKIRNISFP